MQIYEYFVRLKGAEVDLRLVAHSVQNKRFSVVVNRDNAGKEFYELHSQEFKLPRNVAFHSTETESSGKKSTKLELEHIIIDTENDRNFEIVEGKAEQILFSINGAAKLCYTQYKPIEIDCIIRKEPYGLYLRSQNPFDNRSYQFSDEDQGWTDVINHWAQLGLRDPRVEFAFQIYGSVPHNWVTLYLIFEVIRNDCGRPPSRMGWISKAYESRFTGTANNNRDLETGIRHASDAQEFAKAMPLEEGQELVRKLMRLWIEEKMAREGRDA